MKALNLNQRGQAVFMLRGYKTLGNLVDLGLDLHCILKLISSSEPYVFEDGYQTNIESVIANAKKVLKKFYNIRDVNHCSIDDADELDDLSIQVVSRAKGDETFDEFYDIMRNKISITNPFDISVVFVDDNVSYGEANSIFVGLPIENHVMRSKECYTSIFLTGKLNDELSTVYGHEIIHMLTPSGGCLNFQNQEVLSIFNEKLIALELDPTGELLSRVNRFRNKALFESVLKLHNSEYCTPYERCTNSAYVTSTILATHLFDMYLTGDEQTKKRIISGIQGVFDGECTVEDILYSNNINFKNSCNPTMYKKYV